MKRYQRSTRWIALAAASFLCTVASASAQITTATSTFLAPSTTHLPIVITKTADWEFGFLFTGVTPGTATISTRGILTSTGGLTPMATSAVTPGPAAFTVTGDASAVYSVVMPSSMTLTRLGGTQTLTLDGFTRTGTGILVNGQEKIKIGATIHVTANQPSGRYVGTNYVTVAYN